jgi:hypothetical protein
VVQAIDDRQQSSTQDDVVHFYEPLPGMPIIKVPTLTTTAVATKFGLADITDLAAFRKLGRQIAAEPGGGENRTGIRR